MLLYYKTQKEHFGFIITTVIKIRVIKAGTVSGSLVRSCFFSFTHGHSGIFFQLAVQPVARVLSSTVLRAHFQQSRFQKKVKIRLTSTFFTIILREQVIIVHIRINSLR